MVLEAYTMGLTFKCDIETFFTLSFPASSEVYEEKLLPLHGYINKLRLGPFFAECVSEDIHVLFEIYVVSSFYRKSC